MYFWGLGEHIGWRSESGELLLFWKEFNQLLSPPSPRPLLWAESNVISNWVVCIDTPAASVIPYFPLIDKLLPELPASFSMVTKLPIFIQSQPPPPPPPPSPMGSLAVSFSVLLAFLSFFPPLWQFSLLQGTNVTTSLALSFLFIAVFLLLASASVTLSFLLS